MNLAPALPGYVSAAAILTSTYSGNGSYYQIDNPMNLPALFTTGTMNPFPGTGTNADLFQFVLDINAVGRTIRVGLLVDNLDVAAYNAASLTLVQTNGAGATNGPIATTSGIFNDRIPDWVFFDITGAVAGDTFIVRGAGGVNGAATLGGVAFDSRVSSAVTNLADGGPGSLRAIVASVSAGTTITFATNLAGATILLTNGDIPLNQNLTLDGSGSAGGVVINGNASGRIFEVASDATVVLHALILTNGFVTNGNGGAISNAGTLTLSQCTVAGNAVTGNLSSGGFGGGLFNSTGGSLTLNQCTVSSNTATASASGGQRSPGSGGGIYNNGTLTLNECTLAGNSANTPTGPGGFGGGIFNAGNASVTQSTVSSNSADQGGGIYTRMLVSPASMALTNSIVAGNSGASGADLLIFKGVFIFGGANIAQSVQTNSSPTITGPAPINANPQLAGLGNYGGPTQTMPPLTGSPAVDAGGPTGFSTDQRGYVRVVGPTADIGAVEFQDASGLVTVNADSGIGSLRFAATYTTNGQMITFAPGLSGSSVLLTSGEIALNVNLTIDASALPAGLVLNGNAASRIFAVANNANVALNDLTLTDGYINSDDGGGIYNAGTLTLNECTLAGNACRRWRGLLLGRRRRRHLQPGHADVESMHTDGEFRLGRHLERGWHLQRRRTDGGPMHRGGKRGRPFSQFRDGQHQEFDRVRQRFLDGPGRRWHLHRRIQLDWRQRATRSAGKLRRSHADDGPLARITRHRRLLRRNGLRHRPAGLPAHRVVLREHRLGGICDLSHRYHLCRHRPRLLASDSLAQQSRNHRHLRSQPVGRHHYPV